MAPLRGGLAGTLALRIALRQPGGNLGGEFALGLAADVDPDVAGAQADILRILAAHGLGETIAGLGGHEMVILAVNVEQRHGQLLEVHRLAAHRQFALDQEVLLVAVANKLFENSPRKVRAVEDPLFHAEKILNELLVVHMLHEADVFVEHEAGRIEQ